MNTKQTEIGEIPADWEVVKLGECLKTAPKYGINAPAVALEGNLPVYIRITDISDDGFFMPSEKVGVRHAMAENYLLENGDLLLARTGASVGKSYLYNEKDGKLVFAGFLIKISPDNEKLDSVFLSQYLKTEKYWQWVATISMRSGQPGINATEYAGLQIPLPPFPEQTAIAAVLSDTDRLLAALRTLIGKKRAVKTAAMQRLLSGRLRLPGFASNDRMKNSELGEIPEDWEVVSYGDIFQFLSTSTNPRSDLTANGELLYLHYGDIHTKLSTHLNIAEISLPRISAKLVSSAIVKDGDVIMADASEDYDGIGKSVEVCNIGAEKMVSGLHTFLLRDADKRLADGYRGFLHCIPSVKRQFNALATGLKVYGVSKGNLKTVLLPLPPKPEQTAIAQTLSDMDSEIAALEARTAKLAQIKQGLMQNLLTGKIRVNTGAA